MQKTTLNELKGHLFDVIERLKCHDETDVDPNDTISIDTSEKIIDAARVVVECAKVEVQALRVVAEYTDPTKYAVEQGLLETPEPKQLKQ